MNSVDLNEAISVMKTVIGSLSATIVGSTGALGAQARYLCGSLSINAGVEMQAGGIFWVSFAACFEAVQQAGATFENMEVVRSTAEALKPTGLPAIAVRNFAVRMSLAEQARILAAMTFTSRIDIDRYFDIINASFDAAELLAADNHDNIAYLALLSIHSAVSNDLANRSRPLPRMTTFSFTNSLPSLNLAQRIYGDPSRADEIAAENKVIHPLFMPSVIDALSE